MRYKLAAFTISATVTGLGGCLFAYLKLFISADLVNPTFSGEILAMTIFGGMGSFLGPALGAVFYLMFREVVSAYTAAWQFWFGLLFMAFILFSPLGLVGLGERLLAPFRRKREEAAAMAARVTPQPGQEAPAFLREYSPVAGRVGELRGRDQAFGGFTAVDRVDLEVAGPQAARVDRPQRRGQDDFVQPDFGHVRARSGHGEAGRSADRRFAAGGSDGSRACRARFRSPACFRR